MAQGFADIPVRIGIYLGKPQVELNWTASPTPFAVKYRVEFKLATESQFRLASETVATKYEFNALIPGQKYDFRVTAVSGGFVESTPVTVSLTTETFLPGPFPPIPK
tara:strand:+ start:3020 stop:3340 length:321 start_codon:yes stop_codon:yes gene_type:complete